MVQVPGSFQFGNRASQFKIVDVTANEYISGSTGAVSQEFKDLGIGGTFKSGEVAQLFAEILEGDGVDGVSLVGVTGDRVTLAFDNAGQTDIVVFENAGEILDALDDKFQFKNKFAQFKVVDVEANEYISGSTGAVSEEFKSLGIGGTFKSGEVDQLFAELLEGDGVENVEVISLTGDSVTLGFQNRGLVDTVVFENAGNVLDALSDDFQFGNRFAQFKIVDAATNDYISGSTNKVSTELNDIVGGTFRASDVDGVVEEILLGDGVENVELLDISGDSVALAFTSGGVTDTIVFENIAFDFV